MTDRTPTLEEIEARALAQVGEPGGETVWNVLARDVLALLARVRELEHSHAHCREDADARMAALAEAEAARASLERRSNSLLQALVTAENVLGAIRLVASRNEQAEAALAHFGVPLNEAHEEVKAALAALQEAPAVNERGEAR